MTLIDAAVRCIQIMAVSQASMRLINQLAERFLNVGTGNLRPIFVYSMSNWDGWCGLG